MGADLLGYMLFGPVKINKTNIKKAIEHVRKIGAEFEAYQELQENGEEIDENKFPLLDAIASHDGWDIEYIVNDLSLGTPQEEVDEIVSAWQDERRDAVSRTLPGDKKRQVVFAGEMSWGDGAQEGSAWYAFERADKLGLLPILGLE